MKTRVALTLILGMLVTLVWQTHTALGLKRAVSEGLVSFWSFDQDTVEG